MLSCVIRETIQLPEFTAGNSHSRGVAAEDKIVVRP